VSTLGPPLTEVGEGLTASFRYWPHSFLVEELGPLAPQAGLRACHAITRRFTCEFCLRPLVVSHPALVYAALARWVEDPDVNVRRAVSESLRPRLPWGTRLRALQEDPAPALALLERLRDDPELYVRRSVANHLGDIAKDHPERVIALAREWGRGASPERRVLLRHALRLLVKQGHPGALDALGFGGGAEVELVRAELPATCRVGEQVRVTAALRSTAAAPQQLAVDLVVHFVRARGTSPKAFHLARAELAAGATLELAETVRFRTFSTRRQYPGPHAVALQVNGAQIPLGVVDVQPASGR